MANNYQQHSFMINSLTSTEIIWLETKFDEIDKSNDDPSGEYTDIGSTEIERRDDGADLWLYAEEGADLESLVDLLQDFLKENRPDSYLGFEWANTCSKMRLDEFSGGAVFITADKADWISTYDFLETKRKAFEAAK
jgi:hypothetical protein